MYGVVDQSLPLTKIVDQTNFNFLHITISKQNYNHHFQLIWVLLMVHILMNELMISLMLINGFVMVYLIVINTLHYPLPNC